MWRGALCCDCTEVVAQNRGFERSLRNITSLSRETREKVHDGGLLPSGCLGVVVVCRRRELFERFLLSLDAYFYVLTRRFQVGMAKPVFNDGDVASGFDQMKCGGMSENMRTDGALPQRRALFLRAFTM